MSGRGLRSLAGAAVALALVLAMPRAGRATAFDHCLVCHGANANGNPAIHAPRISALEPWYVRNQLHAFHEGWRGSDEHDDAGHEMRPVGQHLDDAGVERAVAFLAGLQSRRPTPTISGDVAAGQLAYVACAACHGAQGEGNASLQAPALAGQSDWYLLASLRKYRAGVRGSAADDINGTAMRSVAAQLPDDATLTDLVAYINTLPAKEHP
jgi:cytochrome c oxidase subunit 2